MSATEQNIKLLISLINKAVEKHDISHLLFFRGLHFS